MNNHKFKSNVIVLRFSPNKQEPREARKFEMEIDII